MELLHSFLNLFLPPLGLFYLFIAWPVLTMFNIFQWMLGFLWKENVRGKVILITGASSGIGEHIAYEYAKKRAILVLVGRRIDRLVVVEKRCRNLGAVDVRSISGDVTSEEDCKRFVDETISYFGHLHHLVNNSGAIQSMLFEEAADIEGFMHVMDVTFWGHVYPTFYALPHLRRTGGKIVEIASISSWLPFPRMSAYNTAKAAAMNFFETLRVEVGPEIGITIATPGWIESQTTKGKMVADSGHEILDEESRDIVVGPWPVAYAEECARAIVRGALKGQHFVTVPSWYSVLILYRVFAPEVLEWVSGLFHVTHLPFAEKPPSKLLGEAGAKRLLYPPTIQKSRVGE